LQPNGSAKKKKDKKRSLEDTSLSDLVETTVVNDGTNSDGALSKKQKKHKKLHEGADDVNASECHNSSVMDTSGDLVVKKKKKKSHVDAE